MTPTLTLACPRLAEPKETSPLHGLGHLIMDQSYVCALIAMMVRALAQTSRGLGLPTGSHGIPGEDGGLVPCRQKWVGLWPACWATSRPGQPAAAWLCVHVCAVGVWVGQQGGFAFLLAWGACVQPCPARPAGVEAQHFS